MNNLVEFLCEVGRLEEAQQVLGDAPSVAAEALGPRHLISLALRGKAARIRHAQPGGAAAGLEELARVVTELGETVGAEHYLTRKHADALAAMRE